MNRYNIKLAIGSLIVAIIFVPNTMVSQSKVIASKTYEKEIKKLTSQKVIQESLDILEKIDTQTVENLITLTEIPAPPFNETERANTFKEMLEKTGIDKAWIDEVGNVVALRKGTKRDKVVALDAHLDTVFPEGTDVTVQHKGDSLFAPGIGDDTRGLSMVIAVLDAMNKAKIQTEADILFIGSVGEEGLGDLRGVRHIFKDNVLKIDSWISIDGGSLGRINNAALGSVRYKAVFKGKGGHSWGAFGLANPHHALGIAISDFTTAASEFTKNGLKTSFNIGRIGGGTSINAIPFESWMEVDMRSVNGERLKQIDEIFNNSMQNAVNDYNKSGVKDKVILELTNIGNRPSGEISIESPIIQRAIAISNFYNAKTDTTIGSTNASIPISMGIPSVCIGRGGEGGGAHSLNEWWLNKNGVDAIKKALLLTIAEAKLAN